MIKGVQQESDFFCDISAGKLYVRQESLCIGILLHHTLNELFQALFIHFLISKCINSMKYHAK